jgi:pheromone shutdown protein TraB
MPCPYATLLGVPGQGVHATRIFGLAFVDIFLTILLSIATAWATNTSILSNFIFWFIVGELLHYAAGTQTAFLTMLGINAECIY